MKVLGQVFGERPCVKTEKALRKKGRAGLVLRPTVFSFCTISLFEFICQFCFVFDFGFVLVTS